MRMVELRNVTGGRLAISQIPGLVFAPGETRKVSPATVKHPAVSQYIGKGLEIVTQEEPKAPVQPTPAAPVSAPAVAPASKVEEKAVEAPPPPAPVAPVPLPAEPMPVEEAAPSSEPEETVGTSLRKLYLSAPGVSEDNVDEVMARFPSVKKIANAKKSDLASCGIAKTDTAALKDWALDRI